MVLGQGRAKSPKIFVERSGYTNTVPIMEIKKCFNVSPTKA